MQTSRHRSAVAVLVATFLLALVLAALTGGAAAAKDDLDLVSRATGAAGAKAGAFSVRPAISGDGRFVAFDSVASNLDPADGDATDDVFARDLQQNTTMLASRASGANGAKGNGNSLDATISGDGRFVAFVSSASNLDPADGDASQDVFIRDLQTNTTTLVSRASGASGARGDGPSFNGAISANGRFVAFVSLASNLSPGDGDLITDVFVRDLQTDTTTLVSRASGADGATGDSDSETATISADGRFVAFTSFASNLDPADQIGDQDVFVRDLQTNTTTLVSRASGVDGAKANKLTDTAAISADGRFVAFLSKATNLDPADGDTNDDVFVRDLQASTTTLVSRATGAAGAKANGISITPAISADGRFVTFASFASNLDPNDDNARGDVFVRDVQANTTTLASRAAGAAGAIGNSDSLRPAISGDGRFVAFDSTASNLHPEDGDTTLDVFRRDVLGATQRAARVSINDVSLAEGNSGETAFRFTVSLDTPQSAPVTVDFATADGTATAPSDYVSHSGAVTFAAGETSQTVTVQVNADTTVEPDETFTLNLANAAGNATIADPQAVATIVNDDQAATEQPARVSINDVRMAEGNAGQTAFRFTVSLDRGQSAPVTVDYATANGTATAASDYVAASGTVTFSPGETAKAVTEQVNGDTTKESNETFNANLSNATGNATIADGHAVGTIVNDDRKRGSHKFMLGTVRLNRKTGTATLAVTVPGPGKLAISGNGVKPARAVVARSARAPRTVQLPIQASGRVARSLDRTGKATVKARVTYRPNGGRPSTRSRNVRLEKL